LPMFLHTFFYLDISVVIPNALPLSLFRL
jgi:hypothetical protein